MTADAPTDIGLYLSPVFGAFHDGAFDIFDTGQSASTELERLAEDGNTAPLANAIEALQTTAVATTLSEAPLPPRHSRATLLQLDPIENRYFSYASMVMPSNDAFIANDDPQELPLFDENGVLNRISITVGGEDVWDAGTELNNEVDAAFFDQTVDNAGTAESAAVDKHPGFINSVGNPGGTPRILGGTQSVGYPLTFGATHADFSAGDYPLLRIIVDDAGKGTDLIDVWLHGNEATGDGPEQGGGAIFNGDGRLSIVNATIARNNARGTSSSGGAILNAGGEVTISGTLVERNNAKGNGGGIASTAGSMLSLNEVTVKDNNAGVDSDSDVRLPHGSGGGIYVSGNATTSVRDSAVVDNVAAESGGGIVNGSGTMAISNVTIRNNRATPLLGEGIDENIGGGGGVWNNTGTFEIADSRIEDNATIGSLGFGGGILNSGGLVSVINSTIDDNYSSISGGGISASSGSTTTLDNVELTNNSTLDSEDVSAGQGGGLQLSGDANATLTNSNVSSNKADRHGGGLFNDQGTLTVSGTTLDSNLAGIRGGAIFNASTGVTSIEASTLSRNQADLSGGGLSNVGTDAVISINRSTIALNVSTDSKSSTGGGIDNELGSVSLQSVTIAGNTSRVGGAGVQNVSGVVSAISSIIAANESTHGDGDLFGSVASGGHNLFGNAANATFDLLQATDLVDADPSLGELKDNGGPTETMAPSDNSIVIGLGVSPDDVPSSLTDQRGVTRPQGAGPDIGAYETDFAVPPVVSITALDAVLAEDEEQGHFVDGFTIFTFLVTRSGNTDLSTILHYEESGFGENEADATDFRDGTFQKESIVFGEGELTKTIHVWVKNDEIIEANENFRVTLTGPIFNGRIETAQADGVILNDDVNSPSAFFISSDDERVAEGNDDTTPFSFTVSRPSSVDGIAAIHYRVAGVSNNAANADDFGGEFPSGTLTFADGQASQTLTVNATGDFTVEPDESFQLTLFDDFPGTSTLSATATITNDDKQIVLRSRVSLTDTAIGSHDIPASEAPTAILMRVEQPTHLTVTSSDPDVSADAVLIYDADVQDVGSYADGVVSMVIGKPGLYAVVFPSSATGRTYEIQSSAGAAALSGLPSANFLHPTDTNGDGSTTPADILSVLNALANQAAALRRSDPAATSYSPFFVDVNRDDALTPDDALRVINELQRDRENRRNETASGEFSHAFLANPLPADSIDRVIDELSLTSSHLSEVENISFVSEPTAKVPAVQLGTVHLDTIDRVFQDQERDSESALHFHGV